MTGISNLGQALDQISRLKKQQNTLDVFSTQIATGKKTSQFSGLGADVLRSQRARADLKSIEQYTTNIKNASRRMDLMINATKQIAAQADTLTASLTSVQGGDLPDFETTKQFASDVYDFVVNLINTKDGERYLFAGSDSSIKPIDDQGQFGTYLGTFIPDATDITNPPITASGFIGKWGDGTITTDQFIDAYSSVNENVLGYSESLISGSTGQVRVRVDDNSDFDYTLLGNNSGLKDLVIALGVLKNMPPPASAPGALNDPTALNAGEDIPPFPSIEKQENFFSVVNDLAKKIVTAVDKIDKEQYRLTLVQAQTGLVKEQYIYDKASLQSVIADAEDIDLTETVVKLQQIQVGLEASFSVTAMIADLTLVNFLR